MVEPAVECGSHLPMWKIVFWYSSIPGNFFQYGCSREAFQGVLLGFMFLKLAMYIRLGNLTRI
ncbi:MAG: hypothetical protein CSA36_07430 [Draconibacterium sp.]|nr:MAG: hypothetical protein CSA36_07430 [Draconibacterium sp.]